jgi:hypothetical protein
MKRLILALLKNPLRLFAIIAWNLRLWKLRRAGRRSVVFNLHNDYFFDIFKPVYELLKQDPSMEVWFAWRHDRPALRHYLLQRVQPRALISNAISPFIGFDLFITAEVTGPDFPVSGLPTRTVQMYHGTGTYNLWEKIDVLNRFDAHLMIGPQYRPFLDAAYAKTSRTPHLYEVGYPKLDLLIPSPDALASRRKQYQLTDDKPVILYAPHWNPAGSLHAFAEDIIIALASLDAHVLVKVHNYLFVQYKEQMWDQRLQGMPACHHNVRIVDEPDTQRVYALADVMITDTGTTAALEFSLLKRPLLVYRNIDWFQDKAHYEVEEAICQTALLFDALPEMTDLLKSIFAGSAEGILNTQRKAQEMLVNRYLYHPGTAAPTAVEAIQKELH